ncbi:MAG TPA: cupin domain-containing protein [Beijerinckia sp.]|jgi:hypothetical protein|nr:cupin domain-containing protein [Beijerinckia sp.]
MLEHASTSRRDILLAPLLATFIGKEAMAAGVDPAMTIIQQQDQIKWEVALDRPQGTAEYANLWNKPSEPGPYLTLVKWYPGFMSAPHWYETDRFSIVVSGTWWVGSGDRFDPDNTVPVPAGGFVHRIARTSHFDGVLRQAKEPAVIAICGTGPIKFHKTDEGEPSWRVL